VLYSIDYLMNICAFPEWTGEATINKKNLPVDAKKAILVVKAKVNWEMCVFVIYLSQMRMI
jgi:hypothetical protein